MIGTVLQLSWWNLRRDPVALVLTFVVPLVFFSVFATVFGAIDESGIEPIPTALVLEQETDEVARRFAALLEEEGALRVVATYAGRIHSEHPAERSLGRGEVAAVVVLRSGFGDSLAVVPVGPDPATARPEVDLLVDAADPAAAHMVSSVLQGNALRLAAELWSAALPAKYSRPPGFTINANCSA